MRSDFCESLLVAFSEKTLNNLMTWCHAPTPQLMPYFSMAHYQVDKDINELSLIALVL